jgi:hypothetical protein
MVAITTTASAREWSVIDGEVVGRADPNRFGVVIVAVDGTADFDAPSTKTISPGFHYVQIASTRPQRRNTLNYVPYAFMAEPCRRYVMYAEYESPADNSPWQLVIEKDPKPLGGCKAKKAPREEPAVLPAPTQPSST